VKKALLVLVSGLLSALLISCETAEISSPEQQTHGPATFQVAFSGHETLPLRAENVRPGMSEERVFSVSLDAADTVTALVSLTLHALDDNTAGFDDRLQVGLTIDGRTVWGPGTVAGLVAQSPVFLGILPGGASLDPSLRIAWPSGTPEQDNPFQGAVFSTNIVVDAMEVSGGVFDQCVGPAGSVTRAGDALVFSGRSSTPTWSAPACSSTRGLPRMTGLHADFEFTPTDSDASWAIGLVATGGDASLFEHVVLFHKTGGIHIGDATSPAALVDSPAVRTWSAGSAYRLRITLKEERGAVYFLQGPGLAPIGGSAWTQVASTSAGVAQSLSPAVSGFDQALTVEYIGP
jgi:hypothetical protein